MFTIGSKDGVRIRTAMLSFADTIGARFPVTWVKLRYFFRFHKRLNLHSPKDLNEKILYLSLKTNTSLWTQLADKYSVRQYVKDCGYANHLVKLYAYWQAEDDIELDCLPNAFVIKSVQGCGDIIVVRNKEHCDLCNLRLRIRSMFHQRYGAREGGLHYMRICPAVIVEELLTLDNASNTNFLVDYKVWCFNGRPRYILTCRNRNASGVDLMLYDLDWKAHPEYMRFDKHHRKDIVMEKPIGLVKMLEIATALSRPFPQVRVDLYNIDGFIYFGEMTFTSLGGMMDYFTTEFLFMAGDMIDLHYVN